MLAKRWCALCFCVLMPSAFAAGLDRIQSNTEGNSFVPLHGSVTERTTGSIDRGALDDATPIDCIRLEMSPTAEQQAGLDQFLERQRDPSSPDYRLWLTPEQYADRFGVTENDMAQVRAWLESSGFQIEQMARGRNWIAFNGTAGQIKATFQTEIHTYEAGGETHFANATEALVPARFAGVVTAIRGLDDFRLHPQRTPVVTKLNAPQFVSPQFNSGNGAHYLAPDDLATIYDISPLYLAGYSGAGQKLAIVGQTDIALSDLRGFRTQFGLAAADPQLVLFGADPGVSPDDQIEADLDLEWSGAVARGAKILYVYSNNVIGSLQYAIDQNLAPVVSMSYGECEAGGSSSFRTVAQQANAQGITWLAASGDSGAAGCDWGVSIATHGPSVGFPSDIPEVTAVGGTEFNESSNTGWNLQNNSAWGSAAGYLPEKAWNDTASGSELEASTGGASAMFAKPSWQTGPGVPSDGARDVPDISLSASANHDGYLIYANGSLMVVGGTSASTPSFAGIVTLINQYVVAKGLQSTPGLGNINPVLYSMAQSTTGAIHDITTGNNIVPCAAGSPGCVAGSFGYKAGVGYDLVTGLGSVDAFVLAEKWNNSTSLGTTMTLSASPASIAKTASTQLTAVVTPVTGTNPPTGSITFTAAGVSLGSAALVASGSTATAKLTVSGSSLQPAANSLTASYSPTGNFAASSAAATVTVAATAAPAMATTLSLVATPAAIPSTATVQLTAAVKPASGSVAPTGSISFLAGNTSLGSATLAASGTSSLATLTVKGSSLANGSNSIAASYAATTGFTASSATASVTVTSTIGTTVSIVAAPASLAPSGTTQLTVTVKPASGNAVPAGTIAFTLGSTALGTASLSASGSAVLSLKGSALAVGNNSIVASYPGSGAFSASSATAAVTVTAVAVSTVTTLSGSTATLSTTGTTQLTAIVIASAAPAGTVTFTAGKVALGTVSLLSVSGLTAAASLTVAGSNLVAGSNSITAAYAGSPAFLASTSAPLTVTVSTTPVATTAVAVANPSSITATGSSQIVVTVRAASGTGIPAGTVTFTSGKTALGSATLAASTASATATLNLPGASLVAGANTISAAYAGSTGFAPSTAALTITVTASTATTTTLTASPASLSKTATTQLTATVKATTGSAPPTGTVTFTLGGTVLGTVQLTAGSPSSVASFALKGTSLSTGANTVSASYQATGNFTKSAGSTAVTLTTAAASPAILTSSR